MKHARVSLLKSVLLQEQSPLSFPASLCRDGAMDESDLEQQVASVGRGITFLEQEHLAMLTGLQLEITHLKRRCHGEPSSSCSPAAPPPSCSICLSHTCLLLLLFQS